jgi:hypothetical protein
MALHNSVKTKVDTGNTEVYPAIENFKGKVGYVK